ncbi:MAG: YceI family protein [Bacteroidota bacterium]
MLQLKTLAFLFSIISFSSTLSAQSIYQIDPTHTFVNFEVERFMVGEVTGRFNEFQGSVQYNPDDVKQTNIDVTIQVKSIDTGLELRDGHLKSNIWLDAEKYPEIKFRSKKVYLSGEQILIDADLTIHGTTREVTFPMVVKGPFKDPTQANTIGLTADLIINREDFGILMDKKMTNGHLFIGNEVKISIRALAALKK